MIARYNVNAFEHGLIEQQDTDYLCTLSADVVPYVDAEYYMSFSSLDNNPPWFCWDASLLRLQSEK